MHPGQLNIVENACDSVFDWTHPKALAIESEYEEHKVRESLEINYASTYQEIKHAAYFSTVTGVKKSTNSWRPCLYLRKLSKN